MVMRVGGLASGMDIDSIVAKLMEAEKAPLNKLYQSKQKYEWQRDAYRDVNKELKAFDTFLFDNMQLQSNLLKQSANSTNAAVSANVTNAKDGSTLTIDKVESLATATRRVGKIDKSHNGNTTLAQLRLNGDQNVSLKVTQQDGTLKDVKLSFKSSDTLSSVMEKLNTNTGLSALYDETSGHISLTTNATGESAKIEVTSGQDFFTALGFGEESDLSFANPTSEQTQAALNKDGTDAKATINGISINRASNTFELNGFSVTLEDEYTGAKPITITSKTDVDNMVDKIKKFVETYNGLIDSMNSKVKEQRYRDYAPLTDEQKEGMEEDQIKKWEEKAKSGLLRSDSLIRNGMSELRGIMYEKGGSSNSVLDTLQELGITTTTSYLDGGKLEIDEKKLRAAIAKDPQAVSDTFTKSLAKGETGEEGIVQKLRSSLSKTMLNIEKKAGKTTDTEHNYSLGKNLLNANDRIDNWKRKLEDIEERYWKQFTAMETAINKANQQSSMFLSGTGQ